jgi:predicted nucleic acid-binding Zn ribbon protein
MPVDKEQLHASKVARARRFPILMLLIMILLMVLGCGDDESKD